MDNRKLKKARRHLNVEAIIAAAALVVAVSSMFVAIWQGMQNREHNRLSVSPIITFDEYRNWSSPERGLGIRVANNGTGPAIITDTLIFVDGEVMPQSETGGWIEAFRELKLTGQSPRFYHFGVGGTILQGESKFIFSYDPDLVEGPSETPLNFFESMARLSVILTYESIYKQQTIVCMNKELIVDKSYIAECY